CRAGARALRRSRERHGRGGAGRAGARTRVRAGAGRGVSRTGALGHPAPAHPRGRVRARHRAPLPRAGLDMSAGFAAIFVLWRRDLYHFVREPMRVLASVAQPLLFWILLGSGFGYGVHTAGGSYSKFFFPGLVLLVVLFACIFSTISVIEDRQQGFLRAVLAAPVPRSGVVTGKILGSATLAFLQGIMVLVFAGAAGLRPGPLGIMSALAAMFLASYALAGL